MTGFALILFPSITAELLLGSSLTAVSGITLGRVAGAALISLASACWLARNDQQSRSAKGLIAAMLLYNITVLLILAYAGFTSQLTGMLLLALIIHLGLTAWCMYALQNVRRNKI
jgi:hypothetical protein